MPLANAARLVRKLPLQPCPQHMQLAQCGTYHCSHALRKCGSLSAEATIAAMTSAIAACLVRKLPLQPCPQKMQLA
jgi:hypothetical protein